MNPIINFGHILAQLVSSDNFFLMGSRSFGLNDDNSDWDYCVYHDNPSELFANLLEIGFNVKYAKKSEYTYDNLHFEIGYKIDIIIINNINDFNRRKSQHEKIRKTLSFSKDLKSFCLNLKQNGVSGKIIYQSLCRTFLGEEPV